MADIPSLNALAEAKNLPAWGSRKSGAPAGYFRLPMTDEATKFFQENGFLVIEDAFSAASIEGLRREATHICRGEMGAVNISQLRFSLEVNSAFIGLIQGICTRRLVYKLT